MQDSARRGDREKSGTSLEFQGIICFLFIVFKGLGKYDPSNCRGDIWKAQIAAGFPVCLVRTCKPSEEILIDCDPL